MKRKYTVIIAAAIFLAGALANSSERLGTAALLSAMSATKHNDGGAATQSRTWSKHQR